ncbi:MAG: hypothetical protein OJF59_002049 [Cytophagales bacterium]|nr:MAG: hypothetical protein OJF59_002049 [Cytophagales bacterium]
MEVCAEKKKNRLSYRFFYFCSSYERLGNNVTAHHREIIAPSIENSYHL